MRKTVQIQSILEKEFINYNLSSTNISRITEYISLLTQWNKKINLTAIRDEDAILIKHVFDTLTFFQLKGISAQNKPKPQKVLDLGSGAGIPGLILSICEPNIQLISVDKSGKKIAFQEHIIRSLNLKNAKAVHSRLESLAQDELHIKNYDIIISRAFDQMKNLMIHADFFLKPEGKMVFWKGQKWQEEMEQIPPKFQERFKVSEVLNYQFKSIDHGGVLLLIESN